MSYVPEVPEDRKAHKNYHDMIINGLCAPLAKSDHIIWKENNRHISVVNHLSPTIQKKRAEKIGLLAHHDTAYDFAPYSSYESLDDRNVHLFLGYTNGRGIAFLLIEKRSTIWSCTWEEYQNHVVQELPEHPPMWSVGLVWVNRGHRRQGWAVQLALEATRFLCITSEQIGWYTPFTDEGQALVKSLCPKYFYIAK
jgi:hypothetical protein